MSPSPLVSIIIPAYNSANYLAATIQSAVDQTWPNKEIIIVDDGSTDGSLAIAKSFESEIVKVFSQENKGASVARNKGLSVAKGEYIQFLDADDLLSSNKLTNQVNTLLSNPNKVAVCSTVHFFNGENPYEQSSSAYADSFLYKTNDPAKFLVNLYGGSTNQGSMVQTNAWLSPASVIKKSGPWSEFYSPDDDGEFFCRVVLASEGVIYTKDCYNYYRKYTSSGNLASIKTQEALEGKYRSFLLKKKYLLAATDDPAANICLMRCAMDLVVEAYLFDKKLTQKILTTVGELGSTNYVPILGGKPLEMIKKFLGWRAALRLKQIYLRLR
jgi:glycosyltransferase involved in cell wall biosynthesis